MKKNVHDLMGDVNKLNLEIKHLLTCAGYELDSPLDISHNPDDAEELFLMDELKNILAMLDDVSYSLAYINSPIKAEGVLHQNNSGRYEFNGIELTSGHGLEYLATDDHHYKHDEHGECINVPYWRSSTIEYSGNNYYIVGDLDLELEGLKVRIREF